MGIWSLIVVFFFFNDTATTEIYPLSLHDALPISRRCRTRVNARIAMGESSSNTVAFTAGWHGPARLPGRPRRKPLSPCLEALPRHAAASLSEDPGDRKSVV